MPYYWMYKEKRTKPYSKYYDPKKRRQQYEQNGAEERAYTIARSLKIRNDLLILLGNKCSNPTCLVPDGCADRRCLQIDHINGDGSRDLFKHRGNYSMYTYYVAHPDEAKTKLQILCANCNWIKKAEKQEVRGKENVYSSKKINSIVKPLPEISLMDFISQPSTQ